MDLIIDVLLFLLIATAVAMAVGLWVEDRKTLLKKLAEEKEAGENRARELLEEWREEHAAELQSQQAQAVAQAKQIVDAAKAQAARLAEAPTPNDLAGIDDWLRTANVMQSHQGRVLSAKVLASPTGRMALEWAVEYDSPRPLQVVGEQDGKVVFREFGDGRYVTQLEPGQAHRFALRAYEGESCREKELLFTVQIPTDEQWMKLVADPKGCGEEKLLEDPEEQRLRRRKEMLDKYRSAEEFWEELKTEEAARIKNLKLEGREEHKRLAKLDAWIARERQ